MADSDVHHSCMTAARMESIRDPEQMNISGIVIGVFIEHIEALVEMLKRLPGIDVHHSDARDGRIVVTQDVETEAEQIAGLLRIQQLPNVLYAELVKSYVGATANKHVGTP